MMTNGIRMHYVIGGKGKQVVMPVLAKHTQISQLACGVAMAGYLPDHWHGKISKK